MAIMTTHFRNQSSNIPLRVAQGHFATNHSHLNWYIDMTITKHRLAEARTAAAELANSFKTSALVDSILCLDGTEVLGACVAGELTKAGIRSLNAHQTIYVVTPEYVPGGQMIFRENASMMITGRHVLILAASVVTGVTVEESINAVRYYDGNPVGICSIFSCIDTCAGLPVTSIFRSKELANYMSVSPNECPLCKAGVKLDAMVNSFGISSF